MVLYAADPLHPLLSNTLQKQPKVTFAIRNGTLCWAVCGNQQHGLTVMYDKVRAARSISIFLTRVAPWAMVRRNRLPAPTAQVGSISHQMTGCLAMGSGNNDHLISWNSRNFRPWTKIAAEWALLTDPCLRQALLEGLGSVIPSQRQAVLLF